MPGPQVVAAVAVHIAELIQACSHLNAPLDRIIACCIALGSWRGIGGQLEALGSLEAVEGSVGPP